VNRALELSTENRCSIVAPYPPALLPSPNLKEFVPWPEATEKNGLLLQLKSYTSCMIGKINNL
jgi:hypothetical protein